MADTTKLAGRFSASRCTIEVCPENLARMMEGLLNFGLYPEMHGIGPTFEKLVVIVDVPGSVTHLPAALFVVLSECDGEIVDRQQVNLICPPAPEEVCRVGKKTGVCEICGHRIPLIGPVVAEGGERIFLLISHRHPTIAGEFCCGTELQPELGTIADTDGRP